MEEKEWEAVQSPLKKSRGMAGEKVGAGGGGRCEGLGERAGYGNDLAEGGGQGCVCARVTSSEETES